MAACAMFVGSNLACVSFKTNLLNLLLEKMFGVEKRNHHLPSKVIR